MDEMLKSEVFFAGIQFSTNADMLPNKENAGTITLSYLLRFPAKFRQHDNYWPTDKLYNFYAFEIPNIHHQHYENKFYQTEGFLTVQNAIANAYAHKLNKNMPNIQMKALPYPAYTHDTILTFVQNILPLVFMLTFGYIFASTTNNITFEKEQQLTDHMKMHGSYDSLHLLSWLVRSVFMQSISMIGILVFSSVSTFY